MFIKRFRRGFEAVPDPLHPARTVQRPILKSVPVASFVYRDAHGKRVELSPDDQGWFDVPEELGNQQCAFRTPEGDGFYPEHDVAEERRLGRVDEPKRPVGRPRKSED